MAEMAALACVFLSAAASPAGPGPAITRVTAQLPDRLAGKQRPLTIADLADPVIG